MQNRTDMVGLSLPEKLRQLLRQHKRWLEMLAYVVSGYVMANAFLFGGVAPFGVAWCAALPKKNSPCAALGAVLGYTLSMNLLTNMKYIAALMLVTTIKWLFGVRKNPGNSALSSVCAAMLSMIIASVTVVFTMNYTLYDVILCMAEVLLAGGATYFFARALGALEIGLGGASRSDLSCVVISFAIVVMGFEAIRLGELSLGRMVAVLAVLLCARYGREAGGAIAGVTAGIAMGFSGGDFTYVVCAYSLGGLVAGVFGHVGRIAAAAAFILMNGLTALILPGIVDVYTALFEIFVATVIFVAIPPSWLKRLRLNSVTAPRNHDTTAQSALKERLAGISEALMDISHTTHQVSDQLGKLESSGLSEVYNKTIDRVCFRCGLKSTCWQSRYTDSMSAVQDCMRTMKREGSINRERAPKYFTQNCCKLDDFLTELNTQFHSHVSREGVQLKVSKVRSVITDQFEGISMMLEEIADELGGIRLLEPLKGARVKEYLEKEGMEVRDVLCYTNEFDRVGVDIALPSYGLGRLNKSKVAADLSGLLEAEFDAPQITQRQKQHIVTYTEKATYTAELGAYQIPSGGNRLCGDAYDYIRNRGGRAHFILSDGMGSGGNAAVDSTMATNLITRLISVGVSHEAALKMVNSALLIKSGDESLATIDICSLDLYTGKAEFYKAGAAPTFLLRDGRAGYVESTSLPAGILRGVAFEKSAITLHEGDVVILVSDGVTATGVDWVKSELESLRHLDMQRICEKLATTAKLRRTDEREDDITVLAIALRRGI